MEAGEERGARRTAAGRVVELREADALGCELVDVRRRDFTAVALEVGVAHVVDEDDDNVRSFLRFGAGTGRPGVGACRKDQCGGACERRCEAKFERIHYRATSENV